MHHLLSPYILGSHAQDQLSARVLAKESDQNPREHALPIDAARHQVRGRWTGSGGLFGSVPATGLLEHCRSGWPIAGQNYLRPLLGHCTNHDAKLYGAHTQLCEGGKANQRSKELSALHGYAGASHMSRFVHRNGRQHQAERHGRRLFVWRRFCAREFHPRSQVSRYIYEAASCVHIVFMSKYYL